MRRRMLLSSVAVAVIGTIAAPPGTAQAIALASSGRTGQVGATNPPVQMDSSMAYDAATHTVVLFGGGDRFLLNDTWTWDGSDWTQQAPATSPPIRQRASMAYDNATRT